jgi:hypothetical protein
MRVTRENILILGSSAFGDKIEWQNDLAPSKSLEELATDHPQAAFFFVDANSVALENIVSEVTKGRRRGVRFYASSSGHDIREPQ